MVVIGIGSSGCNVLNSLSKKGRFVAIDSDVQNRCKCDGKIAVENGVVDNAALDRALAGAETVFLITGLGKGTGTAVAPVVASIARERGLQTIAAVTMPFKFEGNDVRKVAENGLRQLEKCVDGMIVIENEKLLKKNPSISMLEMFTVSDGVIAKAVDDVIEGLKGKSEVQTLLAEVSESIN